MFFLHFYYNLIERGINYDVRIDTISPEFVIDLIFVFFNIYI